MAACERPEADTIRTLCRGGYCFFVARVRGESVRLKTTTSSPLTVLTSWWRLATRTPVISWTIASIIGRAVSINWVLTCLSRSRPFSPGSDLTRCCSAAVKYTLEADHEQITDQMGLNVLGAPAHEFLFKATDPLGNGGFDFALGFHEASPTAKGADRRPAILA